MEPTTRRSHTQTVSCQAYQENWGLEKGVEGGNARGCREESGEALSRGRVGGKIVLNGTSQRTGWVCITTPRTKAQRRFEMSRINRTNGVGEKTSSIPFKNSLTVGTKNILISVHLSSLKKKEIKPPWHLVVSFLRMS